ncbi:LacI family transcriptional regulator [Jiangella aurantiaca]|uniref:LacI family transcriptional regulator n=1 Tax=Jiangella aurantiaca TaxID=2530373 RepID=A0A4R5AQU7_9ACTN|nr:LacI family DNA-binding transcriptional regulator [Jiangella aurantiaca]TDD72732.1 LacI family transcriptional regulator [Jiangella aurantiaca]
MTDSATTRAARLADVARLAGVSAATASRALNGNDRGVREANRARVLEAAKTLGYTTNLAAQAVARGRSRGVMLVAKGMPDDFANPITAGVLKATQRRSLPFTLVSAGTEQSDLVEAVNLARSHRPETLVITGGRAADDTTIPALIEALRHYEDEGGRVVLISQEGLPFDTVTYANRQGGYDMATALVDLGYREFAVISGMKHGMTQRDRTEGFVAGLADADIEVSADRILVGEFNRDAAYAMTGELLRRNVNVEAIFAVNDAMALGVLTFLRDTGDSRRVAVAGFDDIKALRDITPSLTTVHMPWEQIAEEALAMTVLPRTTPPRTTVVKGHVIVRESTPRVTR